MNSEKKEPTSEPGEKQKTLQQQSPTMASVETTEVHQLETPKSPDPPQDEADGVFQEKVQIKGKTVLIGVNALVPVVERHLNKISSVQWALLKEGHIDGETLTILAELVTEIIQTSATDVLKVLIPMVQKKVSPHHKLPFIKTVLGNALSKSIALVLGLKMKISRKTKELTEMIEHEIQQKVLKALKKAQKMPHTASLYVSGCVSNLKRLSLMVKKTGNLLQSFLERIRITKNWTHMSSTDSDFTEESVYSFPSSSPEKNIDFHEAVEGVIKILRKWTNCSEDACLDQATKITTTMMNDMKDESRTSTKALPCVSVVMGLVKDFLASHSPSDDPKERFAAFARKLFDQMLRYLNEEFKFKCQKFLLIEASKSSGTLPGQSEDTVAAPQREVCALLDWELILNYLLGLLEVIQETEPHLLNPETVSSKEEISQVSQNLDKALFEYMMKKYEHHLNQTEESKSEAVKVLQSNTRSAVKEFMHEVLLWTTEELKSDLSSKDKVKQVLADIEDLFNKLIRTAGDTNMKETSEDSSDESDESDESSLSSDESDESSLSSDKHETTENTSSSQSVKGSSPTGKTWNDAVVTGFLLMILSNHLKEKKKNSKEAAEIKTLIESLSEQVLPKKASIIYKSLVVPDTLNNIKTVLITDLQEKFGNSEEFLKAALTSPDSVVEVVMVCVKEHLGIRKEPSKKGCFRRGLSRFATCMRNLFCPCRGVVQSQS